MVNIIGFFSLVAISLFLLKELWQQVKILQVKNKTIHNQMQDLMWWKSHSGKWEELAKKAATLNTKLLGDIDARDLLIKDLENNVLNRDEIIRKHDEVENEASR